MADKTPEQVLANKRRQAYFRRRRAVQAQSINGTPLAVDRMDTQQLTSLLMGELSLLVAELSDGSSPRMHHRAQAAQAIVHELYERGEQLSLF